MIFLYNIFIFLYHLGVRIASLWNTKARNWIEGRKSLFQQLENAVEGSEPVVWVHSSSAGEFEQAKPVVETIRKSYPHYKVLVSFFSPSGYYVARNYKHADYIFYLPLDTSANAKQLLSIIRPQLVIFVKYDFWYHHLKTIRSNGTPLLLISAIFRENQFFFKPYGGFYRKMLFFFKHIFVQDETSLQLLKTIGIESSIGGDTRFDRVTEISQNFTGVPFIQRFIGNSPSLIAGSTWPDDEKHLKEVTAAFPHMKLIIAPHEINKTHLEDLKTVFPEAVFYSGLKEDKDVPEASVLVIDNIGMLSRLYHYATITYIGGGFTKSGIHNTLEAAVYGKPVLFGPNYHKFREAKGLIEVGGGFHFSTSEELKNKIGILLKDDNAYQQACKASAHYITTKKGATETLMKYIQENRLLTN